MATCYCFIVLLTKLAHRHLSGQLDNSRQSFSSWEQFSKLCELRILKNKISKILLQSFRNSRPHRALYRAFSGLAHIFSLIWRLFCPRTLGYATVLQDLMLSRILFSHPNRPTSFVARLKLSFELIYNRNTINFCHVLHDVISIAFS